MDLPALIVGGDSTIGRAVGRCLEGRGFAVERTSRRAGAAAAGRVELDLARELDPGLLAGRRFSVAVFCAAVASQEACRADPAGSREVNVVRTAQLARRLADGGTFLVHLSTNLVFDGSRPHPAEDDAACPRTEYGRQKAEAEEAVRRCTAQSAVIRLTKVLHGNLPLLAAWRRDLGAGRPVRAFGNVPCSVLELGAAADGIALVAARRARGVWHFSNAEDIRYTGLAAALARRLNAPAGLVRAAEGAGGEGGSQARFAALGARRAAGELCIQFHDTASVIRAVVAADARAPVGAGRG
ncbi:MAG TPA: sugar nucleotide-binding protein [Opitutaceae bacterium]|jgi:dTDP-4-dehydrorhamnose reductase